jgi:hypothetical protein
MKNINKSLLFIGVLLVAASAFAQTILNNTTLSSAITSSQRTMAVASVTGITAQTSFLLVDREMIDVRAISSTTLTTVRGANGTVAVAHASGAVVLVIPPAAAVSTDPTGSCTRANQVYLPIVNSRTGVVSDCLGGQWINGDGTQTTRLVNSGYRFPDPGGTALTSLQTNGTAINAATEQECSEVDLPYNMMLTGIGILNGTTVATDKHLVILYDATGKVLANSATAGATTATASVYQKYAFTAKYFAVGPARYFACLQANGTTDTVRHSITAVNDNILAGKITGVTFGTVAAITPPSTYTTALGPYFLLY